MQPGPRGRDAAPLPSRAQTRRKTQSRTRRPRQRKKHSLHRFSKNRGGRGDGRFFSARPNAAPSKNFRRTFLAAASPPPKRWDGGGAEGIRTPDPRLAKPVLSQLSYCPFWVASRPLVGLGGLEPPTLRLSGVRSNHLSYRPGCTGALMAEGRSRGGRGGGAFPHSLRHKACPFKTGQKECSLVSDALALSARVAAGKSAREESRPLGRGPAPPSRERVSLERR